MILDSAPTLHAIEAELTFLVRSGRKPKVVMPIGPGACIERTGEYQAVPIVIHDARRQCTPPTIDREGFALVRSPTSVTEFHDPALVEARYYPEVVDLLKRYTGATDVRIFDHTVRAQDKPEGVGPALRQPVAFVHNDYTERSAWQRVRDLFSPQEVARLQEGRVAFVNVWRSIGASAERFPLAAADGRSVPPDDYIAVDMVYADRVGEIFHGAHSAGQRWFYFTDMRNDEAMLLKCFDSAVDGRTRYTVHTGFANPAAAPQTPPRRSIEVRTILTFTP